MALMARIGYSPQGIHPLRIHSFRELQQNGLVRGLQHPSCDIQILARTLQSWSLAALSTGNLSDCGCVPYSPTLL
jgi:hypothetical protein